LRVLLFGCTFCLVALLIGIPAILYLIGTGPGDMQTNVLKVLSEGMSGNYLWLILLVELATSLISVGIFSGLIERRGFLTRGWKIDGFTGEALTGLFLAPVLLGLAAIGIQLSGHLQWTDIVWEPSTLFISLGWMVLIAFSEELVFRGYILGNLMESISNKWIALTISAFLFAVYHVFTPGLHTLAFANLFLAGMLLGINYLFTKNLWFSFMLHLGWNFFEGPILGFRVSGTSFPSVLQAEPNGDLFITGGDYGWAGSILMTLLLLAAILVLAWAFDRKYNGHSTPAPAASPVITT
jgi:hypothetical protein